jgi:hypothetical protein
MAAEVHFVVFWVTTLCRRKNEPQCFTGTYCLDLQFKFVDEGSVFLQNVGTHQGRLAYRHCGTAHPLLPLDIIDNI